MFDVDLPVPTDMTATGPILFMTPAISREPGGSNQGVSRLGKSHIVTGK